MTLFYSLSIPWFSNLRHFFYQKKKNNNVVVQLILFIYSFYLRYIIYYILLFVSSIHPKHILIPLSYYDPTAQTQHHGKRDWFIFCKSNTIFFIGKYFFHSFFIFVSYIFLGKFYSNKSYI